ncbi:MAG: hypothetical protein HY561_04310 [Gemmatimonadetes bacterium]|nr:hypothetical protein [Gemmatimonadota bacterium]
MAEFVELLAAVGFQDIQVHAEPSFEFRKESTRKEAAKFGVKSVTFTAIK